jgi:hypothetical protein
MYNIVTIDFDIIMAPSITLYNNMVGPDKWENDFMNNPQLALSQADLNHYNRLIAWLLDTVPKMDKNNIHFVFDHEVIIKYLPEAETDFVVTNIDHHHDVCYEDIHKNTPVTRENLTCGNWLKYIADNKNLVRYNWVCNGNSTPVDEQFKNIVTSQSDFRDYSLTTLTVPDCLVICQSPMWVSPVFRPLFFTIMDICNFIHGCHYEIETLN